MRTTDIIRRRRERALRGARRGPRLARALATVALLLSLAAVFAPAAALAAGAAGLLAFVRDLPDVDALRDLPARYSPSAATTRLYAWDTPGTDGLRQPVLIDEIADPRREGAGWARLTDLPPAVVAATLAAVDPPFFDRPPADLAAAVADWWRSGGVAQPQSTLVRDLIAANLRDGRAAAPDDNRRALQDWFLGWQIERRFSRAQILEWSLNTTYYGHLAYGIDAAAQVYFDKPAAALTAGEAALLAAVGRDPAANPFDAPEAARAGQRVVVTAMVRAGALNMAEATAAAALPALAAPPGSAGAAPAFARLARAELERILGPAALVRGGWQVETTLDLSRQNAVACALRQATGRDSAGGAPPCPNIAASAPATPARDVALVVMDPASGAIGALAGDPLTPRSLGTLIRPFIYLTALSQGYTAASPTLDVPQIYLQDGRPYTPANRDGRYLGPLRLREALAQGRQAPAVQVLSWVGAQRVFDNARALGLAPGLAPADLTLASRGFAADPLRIGRAFSAVANGGALAGAPGDPMPQPATIRRVRDARGEEVYAFTPEVRETLSPELAWLLSDMLAGESGAAQVTGQSSDGAWAVSYTASDLVAVWATGEDAAAHALAAVLPDGPATLHARPPGLRAMDVCALSGLRPRRDGPACPTVRDWFVSGTEPVAEDTLTREAAVNRETGRLATIFTPLNLIERRVYALYPPEAAQWAAEQGIPAPPIEYDTVRRVPTRSGGASVTSPEPWSAVSGQWSVVGSAAGPDSSYYRLTVFPGLLPEAVQPIVARGETPIPNGELGVWDTTLFQDGLYTLLLTVVHDDGMIDEVAIPVTVTNE